MMLRGWVVTGNLHTAIVVLYCVTLCRCGYWLNVGFLVSVLNRQCLDFVVYVSILFIFVHFMYVAR